MTRPRPGGRNQAVSQFSSVPPATRLFRRIKHSKEGAFMRCTGRRRRSALTAGGSVILLGILRRPLDTSPVGAASRPPLWPPPTALRRRGGQSTRTERAAGALSGHRKRNGLHPGCTSTSRGGAATRPSPRRELAKPPRTEVKHAHRTLADRARALPRAQSNSDDRTQTMRKCLPLTE